MADVVGTNNGDFLIGTNGDDIIGGLDGNDTVAGTQGHDSVDGGTGFDQFNLRMGFADRFNAATGARTYTLTANHVGDSTGTLNSDFSNVERVWLDTVGNGNFNDTIDASGFALGNTGFGALRLTLGNGNNLVTGSMMSDWITTGVGSNTIDAGNGYDEVYVNFSNAAGSTITVTGSGGTVLTSLNGVSNSIVNAELVGLIGSSANAEPITIDASGLTGFNGQIVFYDNDGTNIDVGSTGSDVFANVHDAEDGNDVYTGNGGADIYDYTYAVNAMDRDTISDFDADDLIDLRFNTPTANMGGFLANQFIGSANFSGVAGQYRYESSGGKTLVQVDTNGDGVIDETLTIANGQFALGETAAGSNILRIIGASGTSANDTLIGTGANDSIYAQGGNDTLIGAGGSDELYGGEGDDVLIGAFDTSFGPQPGDGADQLYGEGGNDLIRGGDGDDLLSGGDGNDNLRGDAGSDTMDGGAGQDFVSYYFTALGSGITFDARNVGATATSIVVDPLGGTDTLTNIEHIGIGGTNFDDVLYGSNYFAPTLGYANQMAGNGGNDQMYGGSGNDLLDGGAGGDQMIGGAGDDVYVVDQGWGNGVQGDSVIEAADSGTDEVATSIDWGLMGTNVENITALGTGNIFLGGSDADNVMTGNGGNNYFVGEGGNDTIDGGGNVVSGNDDGQDIASYQLAPGTAGSIIMVDGTGEDAGKLLVQLVNGNTVETFLKITLTGEGSATITGVGIGAYMGTDTVTNIEALHIFIRTADGSPTPQNQFIAVDLAPHRYGDFLTGSEGSDVMDLGAFPGSVNANGNRGNDTVIGTEAANNLTGGAGDDILRGNGGNDNLNGSEGNDSIEGGAGDDYLSGRAGNDIIDGGTGNDIVAFQLPAGTTGTLRVVTGASTNTGLFFVERVDGATVETVFRVTVTPNGTIVEGLGSAAFLGTDTVTNYDQLHFLVDSPVFNPNQFAQIGAPLVGTGGNDTLQGNFNAEVLFGGDGDDTMRAAGGNDILFGGNGNDFLVGGFGDDRLDGGSGSDRVSLFDGSGTVGITIDLMLENVAQANFLGNDTYVGIEHVTATYGNDRINGSEAANWFWTFSGTDILNGNGGNDYFTVGTDDKTVDGGTGVDTLELADFATVPRYDPLVGLTVSLALQGTAQNTNVGNWTISNVENLGGWTGNDHLTGDDNANILAGQIGNDVLVGGGGNDLLAGDGTFTLGAGGSWSLIEVSPDGPGGDDYLDGGTGGDLMIGGGGNDIYVVDQAGGNGVQGDGVIEAVDGGVDEIRTYIDWGLMGTNVENITALGTGNIFLGGSDADNVMTGNGGNNYFVGEGGNDTIDGGGNVVSGNDDGQDIASYQLAPGTAGSIIMVDGTGEDAGKLLVQLVNGNTVETFLKITLTGEGSATITGVGIGAYMGTDTVTNIEALHIFIRTADGSPTPQNQFIAVDLAPHRYGDFLTGSEGSDVMDLGAFPGSVNANGNRGNDTVIGTEAANNLTGGAGDDILRGNGGNDNLDGNEGNDSIEGGAGDDYMSGREGNDSIDGGTGGNDVAAFRLPAGTPGTIAFVDGTGADAGLLLVQITNNGVTETFLRVTLGASGATVEGVGIGAFLGTDTVSNVDQLHIYVDTPGGALPGQFVGINLTPVQFGAFVAGSEVSDTINLADFAGAVNANGNRGDDAIVGTDAANSLQGGAGDDTLSGGAGNDFLNGQAGNDLLFGGSDIDTLIGAGGNDELHGGDGDDTLIGAFNTGFGPQPGDGNDRLYGEGGNDLIRGGDGDDHLSGGDGNDNLRGDAGSDTIDGGVGDDFASYFFTALGSGITFDARNVGATASSTILDPLGGTDTLTGIERIGIGGTDFDDIIFGSEFLVSAVGYSNQLGGNGGNDLLVGAGHDDRLDGGPGNDTLEGRGGEDVLIGGDGDDVMRGGQDDDFFVGDAGNDVIDGGTGADDVAAFYLPQSTLGSLRSVVGTGADAGAIFIERVNGTEVEVIARVTVTPGGAIVHGLGSASYLGTDTITNVDRLLFSVLTADPVAQPAAASQSTLVQLASGIVSDGYVSGSTVFFDANNNGVLDAGEASTVTDAAGNFALATIGTGTIRAVGGINVDTGLPNLLTLTAPSGSTVINPLTTLVQSIVEQGGGTVSLAEAQGQVLTSLGLSASLDLTTVDILLAAATDPAALAAQRAAVMIATILVGAGEAAAGNGTTAAINAALSNLATQISVPGSQVDLTDGNTIASIVSAGLRAGTDVGEVVALLQTATATISTATDATQIAQAQQDAVIALDQTAPGAPVIVLDADSDTGLLSNDGLTNDTTPTLHGVAEAGSTIRLYDVSGLVGSTVTGADGTWQATLPARGAGAQEIRATATDASGNMSTETAISFVVDTTAGRLVLPDLIAASDSGSSATDNRTNDNTPTIVGAGAEAGARVRLYASDGLTVLGSAIADASGAWSITTTALAEGAHNLTVTQSDIAGNVSPASSPLVLNVDLSTVAPVATSGSTTSETTPLLTGTAEIGASVRILDSMGGVVGTTVADSTGAWSYRFTSALHEGANGFNLVATDLAGNVSSTASTTIDVLLAGITLNGGKGNDALVGTGAADQLFGNGGNDSLRGLGGNDRLFGMDGDDFIDGGAGDDWLVGGKGSDRLFGGQGADVFVFGKSGGSDVVLDFQLGVDKLMLEDGLTVKKYVVGDVNGDGIADLTVHFSTGSITLLNVGTALDSSNFLIY